MYAKFVIKRKQNQERLNLARDTNRYENESPKILPNDESSDSQFIFGHDDEGNSLLIKFTRRRHRIAEVWLILRLGNGQVYTFPEHPHTKIVNATPRIFEGSGLKMECLVPYSKWRITYSGALRRKTNVKNLEVKEGGIFFVRMNFM